MVSGAQPLTASASSALSNFMSGNSVDPAAQQTLQNLGGQLMASMFPSGPLGAGPESPGQGKPKPPPLAAAGAFVGCGPSPPQDPNKCPPHKWQIFYPNDGQTAKQKIKDLRDKAKTDPPDKQPGTDAEADAPSTIKSRMATICPVPSSRPRF